MLDFNFLIKRIINWLYITYVGAVLVEMHPKCTVECEVGILRIKNDLIWIMSSCKSRVRVDIGIWTIFPAH